jgi:hypothetical protein
MIIPLRSCVHHGDSRSRAGQAISELGSGGTTLGWFIVIPISMALVGVYSYQVEMSDASEFAEMSASLSVPPGRPSAP